MLWTFLCTFLERFVSPGYTTHIAPIVPNILPITGKRQSPKYKFRKRLHWVSFGKTLFIFLYRFVGMERPSLLQEKLQFMYLKNSRVDKQNNEPGTRKSRKVAIFGCFWLFDMSWHRNKLKPPWHQWAYWNMGLQNDPMHRVRRGSKMKSDWILFKSMSDHLP